TSCSLRRSFARSLAEVFFQEWNAASAASMARRVSARPHFGTVPIVCPLAGLTTSIVSPESAWTQEPPMRLASRIKWLVFFSMFPPGAPGGCARFMDENQVAFDATRSGRLHAPAASRYSASGSKARAGGGKCKKVVSQPNTHSAIATQKAVLRAARGVPIVVALEA